MNTPTLAPKERLTELRKLLAAKEPSRVQPDLTSDTKLGGLVPGGLRYGASYSVTGSNSLLLALMAAATREGAWCAVAGIPELGLEAAEHFGVALERLVLVPQPGARWLQVVNTLLDTVQLCVVRPTSPVSPANAERIVARCRKYDSTLVVAGDWPGASASLQVDAVGWRGLERGHGLLERQRLRVRVTERSGRQHFMTLDTDRSATTLERLDGGLVQPLGVLRPA